MNDSIILELTFQGKSQRNTDSRTSRDWVLAPGFLLGSVFSHCFPGGHVSSGQPTTHIPCPRSIDYKAGIVKMATACFVLLDCGCGCDHCLDLYLDLGCELNAIVGYWGERKGNSDSLFSEF